MAWTIDYNQEARKFVEKLDPQTRRRIRAFLDERVAPLVSPRMIGSALSGPTLGHLWRYRVGDYRILCELQDRRLVVLVVEIGHRSDVYR